MDLLTAIFNTLMGMTPHFTDTETHAARVARMHVFAEAIDEATRRAACVGSAPGCKPIFSDRRLLAALLLAKGRSESGFAQYVHEGRCKDGPVGARCDSDRFGVPRAHGPWQQWSSSVFPSSDWQAMEGSDEKATKLAAWHAARLLAGTRGLCKSAFGGDEVKSAIAGFSGSCLRMDPERVAYQARVTRKFLTLLPAE